MDANTQLLFHWIPITIGVVMFTPLGETIAPLFGKRWPSALSKRGQLMTGTLLVLLGGFTVSVHTLWIHNKAMEMGAGSFCAAEGVWDCSSVIGNHEWNIDPIFGQPWGIWGMLVFAGLLWLMLCVAKDPNASWVRAHLKIARFIGITGLFVIAYLVYAEIEIGKLCQYCSTAHFAHVMGLIGSVMMLNLHDGKIISNREWDDSSIKSDDDSPVRRRKKQGYVAPIQMTPDREEE